MLLDWRKNEQKKDEGEERKIDGEREREEMREMFQDMLLESSYIYWKASLIFKLKLFCYCSKNESKMWGSFIKAWM